MQNIQGLQSDLISVVSESREWKMLFNIDKCKVMHLGYNNCQADYCIGKNVYTVILQIYSGYYVPNFCQYLVSFVEDMTKTFWITFFLNHGV